MTGESVPGDGGRYCLAQKKNMSWWCAVMAAAVTAAVGSAQGQDGEPASRPADQKVLHVVATAHLDTQWLWTIQTSIDEYVPATLRGNFALFERFPNYTFSFEGAFRYMLAKEYYPEEFARLKQYVAGGRWHVCGSFVDACDVNVPSPESLIRQVLYGNGYFEREFGHRSCDVYLPDCFGFGYALPSVAAHCGLKGFSTQKLTWGSSVGIPFDIGVWEGVDGNSVVAALNPGPYVSEIRDDLSEDTGWLERIEAVGQQSGAYVGYKYFGVGDRGGAPDAESVDWLERAIAGDGPVRVISAPADAIYNKLSPDQIGRLPRYKGEMLMTRHGVGCYTSQAAMKRWNRKNELLADAAERASVIADWLGGVEYPHEKLSQAWIRFLWHQFHDDLTGTSIPEAYTFSWNDEILSLNQFAEVLGSAVGASAGALDTRAEGVPLVVFNPLAIDREDVVEAVVRFEGDAPRAVRVFGPAGDEVPSQMGWRHGQEAEVIFLATVPSVGLAVYDIRPADEPCAMPTGLQVSESGLENGRYRVRLDDNGDVAAIHDKLTDRNLLAEPARLQMLNDQPRNWSEWEIEYSDVVAPPVAYVAGPVQARVIERGPARVAVELVRHARGSTFIQRIRLVAGDAAHRVEFDTKIDWRTPATLLKAAFPLSVANPLATYDLGFGTIERGNNSEKKYEVPAQQWADLTAAEGEYGVTIATDCKYGWDKPDDRTLRLTLIHSPNRVEKDMGWHEFAYVLWGHQGDWRRGEAVPRAARLNQPLVAFQTRPHEGALGRRFSMAAVSTPQVTVRALKHADEGDEIVVRAQEAWGQPAGEVKLSMGAPIVAAREVNGAEQPIGTLAVNDGTLTLSFRPYQPRTLALRLGEPAKKLTPPASRPVVLSYDADVVSLDHDKNDGDFDGLGHSLPGELLPRTIHSEGIAFAMGPTGPGEKNALRCRGQRLELPARDDNRLYLLAASAGGATTGAFTVGNTSVEIAVQDFTGFVGQSGSLIVDGRLVGADGMAPPYIRRDPVAWVGTHRHASNGKNEPYVFCYLFKYAIDLPPAADSLALPDNDRIVVLAVSTARDDRAGTRPAQPLYDDIVPARIVPGGGLFIEPVTVTLAADGPDAQVLYTLDGSEPTPGSTAYAGPVTVSHDCTLTARARTGGRLRDHFTRATFTFVEPREADEPAETASGLQYRYYEGQWKAVPEFVALEPVSSGTADEFSISPRRRDENIGFLYSGYVRVPRDGVYTFFTSSDDGSKLYIADQVVVDNDGLHGMVERSGKIGLRAGMHPIRVMFFQAGGDNGLAVQYEGPGLDKQPVPTTALYHQAPVSR